jgi:hypothetical protein
MSYEINVLVNGNRCKQYSHKGRIYVEAKEGSEYVLEIKNNSWEKVLAVLSVDGLNVVDGKPAEPDGAGYVMPSYTAQRYYGFQYSQESVANFKFGSLGAVKIDAKTGKPEIDPVTGKTIPLGYAASKQDGSEKNAGIIGVKIWDEVSKPLPPEPIPQYVPAVTTTTTTITTTTWPNYMLTSSWAVGGLSGSSMNGWGTGSFAVSSSFSGNPTTSGLYKSTEMNANSRIYPTGPWGGHTTNASNVTLKCSSNIVMDSIDIDDGLTFNPGVSVNVVDMSCGNSQNVFINQIEAAAPKFDMETQWGASRNYKVKETSFDRKSIIHSFDIYYASRESLIAMGLDLGTERKVSFPESFKETKYAEPPKGWKP